MLATSLIINRYPGVLQNGLECRAQSAVERKRNTYRGKGTFSWARALASVVVLISPHKKPLP